jgi:hypothetical protein
MSEKAGATVLLYAKTKAAVIEGWMKKNRPWTDQTTRAKAGLNVSVSTPNPETIRMTLAHGVSYGIWLELAHEKDYGIIDPTIRRFKGEIIEDMQGIFTEMGKSWSAGGRSLGSV